MRTEYIQSLRVCSTQFKMKVAVILLVAVAWASGSPMSKGLGQLPGKIVGGTEATPGEFPWIVSVGFLTAHNCGGSIVNENWIVTSARCAYTNPPQITVKAGDHNNRVEDGTEQRRNVSEVIIHPEYNENSNSNDIALIRVDSPFSFNSFVQAANIPDSDFVAAGDFVVSGWGSTSEDSDTLNDVLMKVTVPLVSNTTCKEAYYDLITPDMLCAGTEGKSGCAGDIGGPLTSGDILVGILIGGNGCGEPGYPGVYESISYFSDWIKLNIA